MLLDEQKVNIFAKIIFITLRQLGSSIAEPTLTHKRSDYFLTHRQRVACDAVFIWKVFYKKRDYLNALITIRATLVSPEGRIGHTHTHTHTHTYIYWAIYS